MHNIARYALWAFVFTVPWDMVTLRGIGTLSKATGMAAFGVAGLAALASGRLRRPGTVFWLAALFTAWSAATLLWTISYAATLPRVITYVQLLASVWMTQEFVRTRDQHRAVYVAFCLGAFVPMTELFMTAIYWRGAVFRFSGSGLNENDLGLTLVLGLPIAWELSRQNRGIVRLIGALYFASAPVAVLLTGARGAFLAGLISLTIIPLTLSVRSFRAQLQIAAAVVVLVAGAFLLVPNRFWDRMMTIDDELLKGTMTGRTSIWKAGWRVLPEHPILGVGVAAYPVVVGPELGRPATAHNLPLGVLVEQGVVGLGVFMALLWACARAIGRLTSPDRQLWMVLGLSWLAGVLTLSWEYRKVTWLFFGLIAAQQVAGARRRRAEANRGVRVASLTYAPDLSLNPARGATRARVTAGRRR